MGRCLRDPTFSRFDTIPECDRHTDRQTDRHTTTANTALSIASRGKNGTHDVTTPLSGRLGLATVNGIPNLKSLRSPRIDMKGDKNAKKIWVV